MIACLIRNASVFAPEALGRRDLLVAGGKLLWMGEDVAKADIRIPESDVVDLQGRRLLPGFIDGHAHLTGGGGEAGAHTRVPPVPLSRLRCTRA